MVERKVLLTAVMKVEWKEVEKAERRVGMKVEKMAAMMVAWRVVLMV